MTTTRVAANPLKSLWPLDPDVVFLNHGSFGSCPLAVLEEQRRIRDRMERQPVQFFVRDLLNLLDEAMTPLAQFVGAPATDIVFVPNATAGVNAALLSLDLEPGDELLTTNHAYNACWCALDSTARRADAVVRVVEIPFPILSEDDAVNAILAGVTDKTRIALLDHVTSATALVLPIRRIVQALRARGVETIVDGAHAPGMVEVHVAEIGAAYYTANCHKWLCAPKGAGFLYVRPDLQDTTRPVAISHGYNAYKGDRSRFRMLFDWVGTDDPSAFLTVPYALQYLESLVDGGWDEMRRRNRNLALFGRDRLCEALAIEAPAPDSMIGTIASTPIPDGAGEPPDSPLYSDPLQRVMLEEFRVEAPIVPWPAPPRRVIRLSAALYNDEGEYDLLARALRSALERERR